MAKLNVELVTPERRLLQAAADEVVAPGAGGLFGVRFGHTPLLSVMQPGPLAVRDAGKESRYFVSGGFVEVAENHVRVLADSAEPIEEIDVAQARERVEKAKAKLETLSASLPEYAAQQKTIRVEQARLEVAGRR